jgi:hypothetical protein
MELDNDSVKLELDKIKLETALVLVKIKAKTELETTKDRDKLELAKVSIRVDLDRIKLETDLGRIKLDKVKVRAKMDAAHLVKIRLETELTPWLRARLQVLVRIRGKIKLDRIKPDLFRIKLARIKAKPKPELGKDSDRPELDKIKLETALVLVKIRAKPKLETDLVRAKMDAAHLVKIRLETELTPWLRARLQVLVRIRGKIKLDRIKPDLFRIKLARIKAKPKPELGKDSDRPELDKIKLETALVLVKIRAKPKLETDLVRIKLGKIKLDRIKPDLFRIKLARIGA